MPYSCELCINAPFAFMNYDDIMNKLYIMDKSLQEVAIDNMSQEQIRSRFQSPARLAILEKAFLLQYQCNRHERHARQYANQRPSINKLEYDLPA